MTFARLRTGRSGEDLALRFLQKRGLKLIEKNFRGQAGEIDIVMRDKREIVFVEVKTRRTRVFGQPEEAVNYRKKLHLARTAEEWIQESAGETGRVGTQADSSMGT